MWSPGNSLVGILSNVSAARVTDVFILVILLILFTAFFQAQRGSHNRFLDHAPSILTSLGILGTFVGIVIGLLHFDPQNIDGSIDQLLEGLKTAFMTSLVGMTSAISFKFADMWWFARKREEAGVIEEVTPSDIHSAITEQTGRLDLLREALVGQEEGTLVGQFKLMRGDFSDFTKESKRERDAFNQRLWEELQNFAEMMSKSATEQVIEALRQVIVDFNENLTEQFGENFKALDESVKELVVWQQQYKEQVDTMSEQYQQSVDSLIETRTAVAGIWEECKEIPLAMAELKQVIEVNQHQIQELNRHLEAFVQMRDKAVEAVPQITQQLDHIGESLKGELENIAKELNSGADQMKVAMLEGATEFKDSVKSTNTAMTDLAGSISSQSERMTETLSDTANQMNQTTRDMLERLENSSRSLQAELDKSVEEILASVRKDVGSALSGVEAQLQQAVSRTGDGVNAQLRQLDEALQKEMNRVMSEMGRALSSITGQFATDYARLVQAMNTVVKEFQ